MFHLDPLNFFLLIVFGCVIGLLGSVLGVGGGIFIVPVLVLALHIPIHQAIAISLVAVAAASSTVASVNVERGLANMRLGVTLEVATAAGSIAGALIAGVMSASEVQRLFAIALFPVAVMMFLKGFRVLQKGGRMDDAARSHGVAGPEDGLHAVFFDPALNIHTAYRVKNLVPASFISFFAGSLSGLLGIGGGVVQVPMMNLMCGVPIKAAAATSNFLIGVSAAASAFIYFKKGLLIPELAAVIVIGVLLGSFAGIHLLYRVKAEKIQMAFSALIFLTAVKMLAA